MNLVRKQKKAAGKRAIFEKTGLHVPPFMIVSVTDKCNLNCKGCYAKALHERSGSDLKGEELEKLFTEADELGISIILLAGGEPLVRKDILELAAGFPDSTKGCKLVFYVEYVPVDAGTEGSALEAG